MTEYFIPILTVVASVIASGGFWAFVSRRAERKDSRTKLLLALAHDRIVYLGMIYIEQNFVYEDEFENLNELYTTYHELGGNGTGTRIWEAIRAVPIRRREFQFKK